MNLLTFFELCVTIRLGLRLDFVTSRGRTLTVAGTKHARSVVTTVSVKASPGTHVVGLRLSGDKLTGVRRGRHRHGYRPNVI